MKNIFVIGAGRSSSSLIKYFLDNSKKESWNVTIGDVSIDIVNQKTKGYSNARAIVFDVNNQQQREEEIANADIVVSMLPASMHILIAKECIKFNTHLATASYVSSEMLQLDAVAKEKGIVLLNECGLDPGIDHASAMKDIDEIHSKNGVLTSFKSYCGGLIAPESNDNPWGYKFSWNPRNVVLAGQGTAKYIDNGEYKYIPYNRLFSQIESFDIDGIGKLEAYANRDSLSYRKIYGIEDIPTMLRGTFRNVGYCTAWNVLVNLGLTDDSYTIESSHKLSYKQFLEAFLPKGKNSAKEKLIAFMGDRMSSDDFKKIEWLGLFEDKVIDLKNASPAQILQNLLEDKWLLKESDKDMIVMQHLFDYKIDGKSYNKKTTLVVKGDDQTYTAMAKTVGLPLAIVVKLILQNKIEEKGVVIPTIKNIYTPLLKELERDFEIVFYSDSNK